MKKKKNVPFSKPNSLRVHRQVFALNDIENKVLNRYIEKYKIKNKSKFLREVLMTAILKRFDEDHPTLFD